MSKERFEKWKEVKKKEADDTRWIKSYAFKQADEPLKISCSFRWGEKRDRRKKRE